MYVNSFMNPASMLTNAAQAVGSMDFNKLKDNIMSVTSTESPSFTVPSNGGDDNNDLLDQLQAENDSLNQQVYDLTVGASVAGAAFLLVGAYALYACYRIRSESGRRKSAEEAARRAGPQGGSSQSGDVEEANDSEQPTKSGCCPTPTKALASFCCSFPCGPSNCCKRESQDPTTFPPPHRATVKVPTVSSLHESEPAASESNKEPATEA